LPFGDDDEIDARRRLVGVDVTDDDDDDDDDDDAVEVDRSANAVSTCPNTSKDVLIAAASVWRSRHSCNLCCAADDASNDDDADSDADSDGDGGCVSTACSLPARSNSLRQLVMVVVEVVATAAVVDDAGDGDE
jgi:hypothetical protein